MGRTSRQSFGRFAHHFRAAATSPAMPSSRLQGAASVPSLGKDSNHEYENSFNFERGFRTVTPYIFLPEAEELIGFVQRVFAGVENRTKCPRIGPRFHSEVRIRRFDG